MNEAGRIIGVLFAVAAGSALIVGAVHEATKEAIEEAHRAALHRALMQVLPTHANDPIAERFSFDGRTIWPARDAQGRLLAVAFETIAPDGYGGPIRILLGVHPDGSIVAIRITDHRETPGLGDGIERNGAWLRSFAGKTLHNARWAVKKDGGDFDQFTGATISPRAVVRAVHRALQWFAEHRKALLAKAEALRLSPKEAR